MRTAFYDSLKFPLNSDKRNPRLRHSLIFRQIMHSYSRNTNLITAIHVCNMWFTTRAINRSRRLNLSCHDIREFKSQVCYTIVLATRKMKTLPGVELKLWIPSCKNLQNLFVSACHLNKIILSWFAYKNKCIRLGQNLTTRERTKGPVMRIIHLVITFLLVSPAYLWITKLE